MSDPVFRQIPVKDCIPGPNVRKDMGDLDSLCASIERQGLLEPIVVRPTKNGKYQVVAGFRRFAAVKRLKHELIAVNIMELSDDGAQEVQAVENLQRAQLTISESLAQIKGFLKKKRSAEQISTDLGLPLRNVEQLVLLSTRLAPAIVIELEKETVTVPAALVLVRFADHSTQLKILSECQRYLSSDIGVITRKFLLARLHNLNGIMSLADAGFQQKAEPSCVMCTKRSDVQAALFEDRESKAVTCLDQACFIQKSKARRAELAQAFTESKCVVIENKPVSSVIPHEWTRRLDRYSEKRRSEHTLPKKVRSLNCSACPKRLIHFEDPKYNPGYWTAFSEYCLDLDCLGKLIKDPSVKEEKEEKPSIKPTKSDDRSSLRSNVHSYVQRTVGTRLIEHINGLDEKQRMIFGIISILENSDVKLRNGLLEALGIAVPTTGMRWPKPKLYARLNALDVPAMVHALFGAATGFQTTLEPAFLTFAATTTEFPIPERTQIVTEEYLKFRKKPELLLWIKENKIGGVTTDLTENDKRKDIIAAILSEIPPTFVPKDVRDLLK